MTYFVTQYANIQKFIDFSKKKNVHSVTKKQTLKNFQNHIFT